MQHRVLTCLRGMFVGTALLVSLMAAGQERRGEPSERKPFAGPMETERRHSLLDAWKQQREARTAAALVPLPQAVGGTAIVGRPSMVINPSNSIVYTRQYLGYENNCDVNASFPGEWRPNTAFFAGDHVRLGFTNAMATTSGTTGSVEPSCGAFGSTIVDGTVTWICEGNNWGAGLNYTTGMVVFSSIRVGFMYQALSSGTSGATEPKWPTDPGGTVVDNGITWKAIGTPPGAFRGCNPMEMAIRASGGGETVVVSEGQSIDANSQVFGWSEHIDMNSSGVVAFKAAISGHLSDEDEFGTGVFTAGPGAGTLTKVVSSGQTAGGRYLCGFSSMVAINDSGQVLADAYGPIGTPWQPSTAYAVSSSVVPVVHNGRRYIAMNAGTSGSTEPAWPTAINGTVVDGTITWRMFDAVSCNDTDHSLIRHTPGIGTELLVAPGTSLGGATVTTLGCTNCIDSYLDQIDGRINDGGKVPAVVTLDDGTEGVYIFTGPGTATEVARTSVLVAGRGPATQAIVFESLEPRVTINDVDQVVFSGFSGGIESIFRYTPPGTIVTVASVGDDVGTRTGGQASGVTITALGNYFDLNNSGNVVFMADLSSLEEAYFFWNGSTGVLTEIHRESDTDSLAPELISLSDANVAAYVTGAQGYDFDIQEGPEFGGVFLWQNGTSTKVIAVGDVIGGDTVTGLYAQHHTFARRQFSSSSCVAVAYTVNNDDIEMDCSAGDAGCYTKSPLIFTACAAVTATPTLTTTASASVPVGGTISDTAQLSGGTNPTGTITFNLYGPADATCSGTPVFTSSINVTGNGSYTSASHSPSAPGTYRWIASYSGDGNNNPVSGSCNDANESVVVTKATPTLTTTASGSVPVGGTISDSATLTAGYNPTGTITFNLYGPGDTACSGTPVFTSSINAGGPGTYSSANYTPTAPGTYRWVASYSGDANNNAVANACGDPSETVTVTQAAPALATSATATAVVGTPISDTATLSGGFNPSGSITFTLFGPADSTCSGAPVFTSTVTVTGIGNYSSAAFTPTAPGTYRWIASYSGDANNAPVSGACGDANESTVVNKASPAILTSATPTATVGTPISDTATLSGGFNAGGTITFSLFSPAATTCSTAPIFTSTIPVTGNGNYTSGSYTPTAPGTYRWIASYSGDANNNAVAGACNDPNESTTVTQASPAIATTATATAAVGSAITDTATLSGGYNPSGSITFSLFGPADSTCAGPPVFTSTVPVTGNGNHTSAAYTPTVTGTYRWIASYSGDANNAPVSGACGDPNESTTVTQASPSLTTTASPGVPLGGSVNDTATLTGGFNPTGSITFRLYGPNDGTCSTAPVFTSTVAVTGNGNYTSGSFTPPTAGTYRWVATYSGDANNSAVANACGDPSETVVISSPVLATPTLTTTASADTTIGNAISDTATLTGGNAPGGTITFTAFGPNDATCSGTPAFTSTIAVAGNGTYTSASFTPSTAGTYRWVASYSGDANNNPVATACNDPNEDVVVSPAAPSIVTTASGSVPVGGSVTDTATLSGGFNPGGTITFRLFGPNDATCAGTAVFTSTVPVTGNGAYTSAPYTATAPGAYRWTADYSGDANNAAANSPCNAPNESVIVTPAGVALTTTASPGVVIGGSVFDTAQLSGGVNPSGTITFTLFGPNDAACSGTAVFTSVVSVAGNGSYTSGSFTPTAAGTYRWVAVYSGDANNAGATSPCNAPNESVVVSPAGVTLTTTASPGVVIGGSVFDTAQLSGGTNPTGTITFSLFGPNDAACSGTAVFTSAVNVAGNGSYTSASFTPAAPGTYRWTAVYSGDANHAGATSPCNAPNESVVVSPASPALTTTASPGITLGGSVTDTAVLSGGFSPSGTITFSLFGPDNTACSGTPVFTSVVTVAGNGSYTSGPFTPTAAGTYRWVAVYSGDVKNNSAASPCNAPNESVIVSPSTPGKASPTVATTASPDTEIGGTIRGTATLSGGNAPTGTITFNAYGPIDSQCTGTPAFTATVAVNGNGSYESPAFRPTSAGVYRFVATYSGDANNNPAASACSDPNATAVVTRATPAITTTASPSVPLGGTIRDTAVLSGGFRPQGTLIFTVFGPDNPNCAGAAAFSSSTRVNGNGTYRSAEFLPTLAGTYRFVVRYVGDLNNNAAISPCNAPNESVVVTRAVPALTVTASASVPLGGTINGTAALAGGVSPSGTITFNVYGPNNASCSGTPRFTSTVVVSGSGNYASGPFTPTEAGVYRFTATYSGDANHSPVTTACTAAGASVEVTCGTVGAPVVSIVGEATTGQTYTLTWTAVTGARAYLVEEATNASFTDATTRTVEGTSTSFRHETGEPKAWFYRVTPIAACDGSAGQTSDTGRVVVVPLPPPDRPDINVNIPVGSTQPVVQRIFIPGFPGQTFTFTAAVDQPWLRVSPQSGTFTPAGMTFDITADPTNLINGTHTGTLIVTLTTIEGAAGRVRAASTTTVSTTVSVNLVTPVTNIPSTTPQENSIIIPSLGHLQGATARWQSDIRVLNATASRQSYQVIFTPGTAGGSTASKSTLITVDPGQTIALDDVVRNWFGLGSLDDRTSGWLEIRPLALSIPRAIASSRTYSLTTGSKGTLGQFIPALAFTDFIGRLGGSSALAPILSMQQIAQSAAFRTNVGLVEASGKAGTALLRVFNTAGSKLLELPVELAPNEQKQLNNLLAQHGIALDDGRVEVQMTSGDGKVTAYASVIDNRSGVPLFVSGVPLGAARSSRYVVPGVADLNTGAARWRTDMRVFNSDTAARTATLVFHPQNNGTPVTREVTIGPGEIRTLDDVVKATFGQADVGGAVHVITPEDSSLVVTARTYNVTDNGTLGQFIPAVTPAQAVGRGERALQILQAEDSSRYRTNLGIAEVSGRPVTVEIQATLPDGKATPSVTFQLQPNEFRQFRILRDFGLANAYNTRITVRAVGGDGRVTAYGSLIDLTTESPTYIPAQ